MGPEALKDVLQLRAIAGQLPRRLHTHHQKTDDHSNVTDRVGEEAPAFPDTSHQDASNGRTHDPGSIEHRGIQRDCIHQVFFAYHVHQKRLACRDVECVDHPQQGRQHEDVPHLHLVGECESGQDKCQDHRGGLGSNDDALPVMTIRRCASKGGNQEDRNLACKTHCSQ